MIRLRVNPAQGVATQPLNLLPPPIASQDTPGERNTLLFDGISTFTVGPGGVCEMDRSITTYQQNASGQPDNSYLNTNILFQAMYAARYTAAQITSLTNQIQMAYELTSRLSQLNLAQYLPVA